MLGPRPCGRRKFKVNLQLLAKQLETAHTKLSSFLSPSLLLTTRRAPSGAANFLLTPLLTCENSRGLGRGCLARTGHMQGPCELTSGSGGRGGRGRSTVAAFTGLLLPFTGCCQWDLPQRRAQIEPREASHSWSGISLRPPGLGSWSCQLMFDPGSVQQLGPGQDSPDRLSRTAGGGQETSCPPAFLSTPQKGRLGPLHSKPSTCKGSVDFASPSIGFPHYSQIAGQQMSVRSRAEAGKHGVRSVCSASKEEPGGSWVAVGPFPTDRTPRASPGSGRRGGAHGKDRRAEWRAHEEALPKERMDARLEKPAQETGRTEPLGAAAQVTRSTQVHPG